MISLELQNCPALLDEDDPNPRWSGTILAAALASRDHLVAVVENPVLPDPIPELPDPRRTRAPYEGRIAGIWDITSATLTHRFDIAEPHSLVLSRDRSTVGVFEEGHVATLVDVASKQRLRRVKHSLTNFATHVTRDALCGHVPTLVYEDGDRDSGGPQIFRLDLATSRAQSVRLGEHLHVTAIAFSADGHHALVAVAPSSRSLWHDAREHGAIDQLSDDTGEHTPPPSTPISHELLLVSFTGRAQVLRRVEIRDRIDTIVWDVTYLGLFDAQRFALFHDPSVPSLSRRLIDMKGHDLPWEPLPWADRSVSAELVEAFADDRRFLLRRPTTYEVYSVGFSPDPIHRVTAIDPGSSWAALTPSHDEIVVVRQGQLARTKLGTSGNVEPGLGAPIVAMSADPSARHLLCFLRATGESNVALYSLPDGNHEGTWDGGAHHPVAWPLDGTCAYVARDREIVRVPLDGEGNEQVFGKHHAPVRAIATLVDGDHLISGGQDRAVRIWSLSTAECVDIPGRHEWAIKQLVVHPNGQRFSSLSTDGELRTWTLSPPRCDHIHTFEANPEERIAVSSTGKIATVFQGRTQIHEIDTDKRLAVFDEGPIHAVSSEQEHVLIIASKGLIWVDLATLERTLTPIDSLSCAALSPSGDLVVACSGIDILILRRGEPTPVATWTGRYPLTSCCFAGPELVCAGDTAGDLFVLRVLGLWG